MFASRMLSSCRSSSFLLHLIVVIANLLYLAIPLLSRLTNDPESVYTNPVSLSITINDENYQTADILEFHKPQGNCCRASRVPILFFKGDCLRRGNVICLFETQDVRAIDVDLDCLWSHGNFFVVFGCRREGSNLYNN